MAAQMGEDLPELLRSDAQRATIFAAVLRALQHRPAIIVFEDVHWADEATLDLLRFVGRRITLTSALLVMIYRDDELGPRHPLRVVLGDLASSSTTHHISLPSLSEQAVRILIGERGMDATVLHQQTGGNPFFVTEVLASATSGIPLTIRDAVLARAARLSPAAYVVLEAAAVIGPRIEPWVLSQVTDAESKVVEECLAIGVLVSQGDALAFRHELARKIIIESLLPHHKAALHRRTLETLVASPPAQIDLTRLAHHAEAAGDRQAILEYAPAAARQAVAANAHCEAAALYSLALRYADDLTPASRAQLLQSCALECSFIDQRGQSIEMLRRALALWLELGEPVKQAVVLAQLANILIGLGRDEEAEQCSHESVAILEAHPPGPELVHAYRVRAGLNMIDNDFVAAIAWAEKSIALAERLRNVAEYYSAQNILWSSWMTLDYQLGRQQLEENLAAARDAGRTGTVAHAYAQLGSISSELHRFRQADRYLSEGIAYAAQYDLNRLWFYMLAWQAITRLHLGDWNEAADAAETVLRHASPSTVSYLMALVALGRLRARRGDPQANDVLDEALELSRPMSSIDRIGPVRAARAEAAWLAGDPERALEEARAAHSLAMSKHHPWYTGELAYWRWQAGDEVLVPEWMAKPFALHIAGDWRAAAETWEQLGCPYEQARTLAEGDSVAQVAALAIFERLGARPAAEGLRRRLQTGGVLNLPRKPRAATRENPFGLTHRQVEILTLLTQDLSNAAIAARLHISPKTVDHHVSAVLTQLDVHSREAAAALARQHPHFQKK
jgi:DNA-binding CsgD family transcriptional regulator